MKKYILIPIILFLFVASSVTYNNIMRIDRVTETVYIDGNIEVDTIIAKYSYIKQIAHGFYAFEDSSVVIDCVQDTWVQITNLTGDLFTEIQTDAGFIISGDTVYFNAPRKAATLPHVTVQYEIDGSGGNNKVFSFRMKNVTNNAGIVKKTTTKAGANDQLDIVGLAYDRLADYGDAYIFEIRNETDNTDFTVNDGGLKFEVSHY